MENKLAKANNLGPLILRPIAMEDIDAPIAWSRNEEFCLANGWKLYQTPEELMKWWDRCVNHSPDDFLRLGIEYKGQLVGYVDLAAIQKTSAELGLAIGDSSLWGKGIGASSAISMMSYAFNERGISNFWAETYETNLRSRRMLEKIGFKEVSRTTQIVGGNIEVVQNESNEARQKEGRKEYQRVIRYARVFEQNRLAFENKL